MKKYFLLFGLLIIVLSSCKKGSTSTFNAAAQAAADDATIQAYLKTNNITATKDASGLYYQIITAGGTTHPTASSYVTLGYVGTELDGTVFDQSTSITLSLTNVIQGWQIGVPKIGAGGEIKLFIPSALAYANQGNGPIAPNTVIMFDIKLSGFN